jgi:hypothetical protein
MGSGALSTVGKAASERIRGVGPGPFRAAVAAVITGTATALLTYRALRSDGLGGAGDD